MQTLKSRERLRILCFNKVIVMIRDGKGIDPKPRVEIRQYC